MHFTQILGESAVRSLALAVVVALLLRGLRIEHARFLKRIWTGVLMFSLAMPLLVALHIPRLTLTSPWSTPRMVIAAPAPASARIQSASFDLPAPAPATSPTTPGPTLPTERGSRHSSPAGISILPQLPSIRLWQFGLLAYIAVTVILLVRVVLGLWMAAELWRTAQPFATDEITAPVRLSLQLQSPATLGSGILLPLDALGWDAATLTATLAHEAEHVREGDFYLQLAATLHLCFFWISPLAWWLRSKLAHVSEMLCDRAAVERTGDGLRYAELLLRFANSGHAPAGMVAMAHVSGLSERIERLLADPQLTRIIILRRGRAVSVCAALVICALASAGTVRLLEPQVAVLAAPQAPPAPPALVAPSAPPATPAAKPPAAVAADRDITGTSVPAIAADKLADDEDAKFASLDADIDTDHEFTICEPEGTVCSFHGRTVPGTHPAGALLFERDGKTYLIDDPATVKRVREAFAPLTELAKQAGELGARQGLLGVDQGELGALTAKLAAEQAKIAGVAAQFQNPIHIELPKDFSKDVQAMTDAQVKLSLEHDTLSREQITALEKQAKEAQERFDHDMQQFRFDQKKWDEEWTSHMREQTERMRKEMEPLEKQIREQASKQAALGAKQAQLGSRQAELGRELRARSRQAEQTVHSLLDQALKNGTAKPLP